MPRSATLSPVNVFQMASVLLSVAALFSYCNHRFIKLPTTIGLMLISMVLSLLLIGGTYVGLPLETSVENIVRRIDFNQTLMQGMLSFLLFAGALHMNLESLLRQKWTILTLATVGVIGSTFLVALLFHQISIWIGITLPWIYCLVFGALISPTDPIAVLSLLKQAKAPLSLETKIAGESLFNDGVGVVVFLVIYEMLVGAHDFSVTHVGLLLFQETLGGIVLGLLLGWVTFRMLRSIENYQVEVLLTLALVTGGYALAAALHTSGPLAIVAAGLMIGNHGRRFAMSDTTREHLDTFWELTDEILNAVLFVLIGLEILVLTFNQSYLLAGLLAIPVVLMARFVTVGSVVAVFRLRREFTPKVVRIMTWGGLRGGISVALALSLPLGPNRDVVLAVTYCIVAFSILVQGMTMPTLLRKVLSS